MPIHRHRPRRRRLQSQTAICTPSFENIIGCLAIAVLAVAHDGPTAGNDGLQVPSTASAERPLDDRLLDLQLKIEDDLRTVEKDANNAASLRDDHVTTGKEKNVDRTSVAHGQKHDLHKEAAALDFRKDGKDRDGEGHAKFSGDKSDRANRLSHDLKRVRSDISNLMNTVTEAEWQLAHQERVIQQKAAKMNAEKILDDLHRGKLDVHVDYVTGELRAKKVDGDASVAPENQAAAASAAGEKSTPATDASEISSKFQGEGKIFDGPPKVPNAEPKASQATDKVSDTSSGLERSESSVSAVLDAAAASASPHTSASADVSTAESAGHRAQAGDIMMLNPDLKKKVEEEINILREGSDPAVMSLDMQLLFDTVALAITAATFGLVAVWLGLPPTAGFLLGGMLIGPSCWNLIKEIRHVQTLAQFGSIFLLFEQGLLYSQTYAGAAVAGSTLATGHGSMDGEDEEALSDEGATSGERTKNIDASYSTPEPMSGRRAMHLRRSDSGGGSDKRSQSPPIFRQNSGSHFESDHDPNAVGGIILVLLIFSSLTLFVLTSTVTRVPEAILVSSSVALCSTTIVSENLHAAGIAGTNWGKGVLKMIAIQDLFMVPLLALPEIMESLYEYINFTPTRQPYSGDSRDNLDSKSMEDVGNHSVFINIMLVGVFVKFSMLVCRHLISAAMNAEAKMMGEKGELFTLSIVAYALLMASLAEELNLSIEAGAVLAGIFLYKSQHVPKILKSIQPITSVFGGMYLTSLGMIMSPSFFVSQAGPIVQLVVLVGLYKLTLVSTILNRFFDCGVTASLAVGSAMAQISETSLVVLAKAQRLGLVNRSTYLMLIPTTFILLTLAPFSTAHLRQLKVQEIAGNDDARIPAFLCFLRRLLIRHSSPTERRMSALHSGTHRQP